MIKGKGNVIIDSSNIPAIMQKMAGGHMVCTIGMDIETHKIFLFSERDMKLSSGFSVFGTE